MTIPASELVQVIPNVISSGGNPLSMNSVFLTESQRVPLNQVAEFGAFADVEDFFGPNSDEARLAAIYFNGFNGCTVLPGSLYFAQYNTEDVAAYIRGGSLAGTTLAELQLINATLSVTVDGTLFSGTVNLAGATSFTNAAQIIAAALDPSAPYALTVSWDAQLSRFFVYSATTGASSTISFGSGAAATSLGLTEATGAIVSDGSDTATPAAIFSNITAITQNWALFMTVFEPDTDGKLAFAEWVQTQGQRYGYVAWDSDSTVIAGDEPTSFGAQVLAAEMDGIFAVYDPDGSKAAFVCGTTASIDFARADGRITYAFRSQDGLTADVSTATAASYATANGYNFYADYATANDRFVFMQTGMTAGKWNWFDSYVNQIWLNSEIQLAYMSYLSQARSVPYNATGYSKLRAVALDPILAAVNFGAIRAGVTLSNSQKAQVNSYAGADVSDTIYTAGWYLGIRDPGAVVRGQRGSPVMTLIYTDGQSVQRLIISSTNVQ